jgi:flagellar biosynthesis/type III secretory pathway chaperone
MVEDLERVMQSEVEVGESLLRVMAQKQRSIVGLHGDQLTSVLVQEEEMIRPFQELELRRMRITNGIVGRSEERKEGETITLAELLRHLSPSDAVRISTMSMRLRTVTERIIHMNEQNRLLLQRSLRFVQETLRLVTEDHKRQFVDHRM